MSSLRGLASQGDKSVLTRCSELQLKDDLARKSSCTPVELHVSLQLFSDHSFDHSCPEPMTLRILDGGPSYSFQKMMGWLSALRAHVTSVRPSGADMHSRPAPRWRHLPMKSRPTPAARVGILTWEASRAPLAVAPAWRLPVGDHPPRRNVRCFRPNLVRAPEPGELTLFGYVQ